LLNKKTVGYDIINIIIEYNSIRQIMAGRFIDSELRLLKIAGPGFAEFRKQQSSAVRSKELQ